ncbi:MAG: cysteine desulfurase [Thermoprotei archaeon]|nr:MAG: cysteine desulfurase [Thermoprotei archaeon]RLE89446.1 MAG: cysteine desulfurase [Thermoprotei archaeon]
MINIEHIREDFPLLKNTKVIYLDNAATTQKPIQVIEAISEFYSKFNANIHRGIYDLSEEATELYEEAHEEVAKFIKARSWEEVIFTRNTTEALNILALSLSKKFIDEGDEIIVTIMDHHSNLLPWFKVAEYTKTKVKVIKFSSRWRLTGSDFENCISERTRVIALPHISNVLGVINDVKSVAKVAHEVGALLVVDGAQSVPHMPVDVRELEIDFLAFSGHKMLGPTGIGVLWGREDILEDLPPVLYGGDMVKSVLLELSTLKLSIEYNDLPWKFEAGTPNIAGGIGLCAAVKYLERIGMNEVHRHERDLLRYTLKRFSELEDKVSILGPLDMHKKSGLLSFNLSSYDPFVVASWLATDNIAVRAGFHCAQPLYKYLGLDNGSVRVSFYIYNTKSEVDALVDSVKRLLGEK